MLPVPMPIESAPSNVNHHIHFTLAFCQNITKDSQLYPQCKNFGTMPEYATAKGKFLGTIDKRWSDTSAAQFRNNFDIPNNIQPTNITQSSIPFATINCYNLNDELA